MKSKGYYFPPSFFFLFLRGFFIIISTKHRKLMEFNLFTGQIKPNMKSIKKPMD